MRSSAAPYGPLEERSPRSRLAALLERVEGLPRGAAGALVVGDWAAPVGVIFAEHNRVCWCVANGMRPRLRDILRGHLAPPLDDAALEVVYDRCREERRPLGEALVEEGMVTSEQLRAAMKQQTIESLLTIDGAFDESVEALPWEWRARAHAGYNPSYTFAATEVLASLWAHALDPLTRELMDEHLELVTATGCAALAFAGEPAALIGAGAAPALCLDEAHALTSWATAALAASSGFEAAIAEACARDGKCAALAWRWEGVRYAALSPTVAALRRAIGALDRLAVSLVFATKLDVLERVRERFSDQQHH